MHAIDCDTVFRRAARRALALLGLAALLLAAGLDTAEAAEPAARAASGTTWLAFAVLAVALFAVFRFANPARVRRPADVRRRPRRAVRVRRR